MLVTSLVFQSPIGPYVDSTLLLVLVLIQSSTTFRRPLVRPVLSKGTQSGTGSKLRTRSNKYDDITSILVILPPYPKSGRLLLSHFFLFLFINLPLLLLFLQSSTSSSSSLASDFAPALAAGTTTTTEAAARAHLTNSSTTTATTIIAPPILKNVQPKSRALSRSPASLPRAAAVASEGGGLPRRGAEAWTEAWAEKEAMPVQQPVQLPVVLFFELLTAVGTVTWQEQPRTRTMFVHNDNNRHTKTSTLHLGGCKRGRQLLIRVPISSLPPASASLPGLGPVGVIGVGQTLSKVVSSNGNIS